MVDELKMVRKRAAFALLRAERSVREARAALMGDRDSIAARRDFGQAREQLEVCELWAEALNRCRNNVDP
jgi:phage FluMu gp28-like protein